MVKSKNPKTKTSNYRRVLRYFWQALMQYKVRTITILILIPIWVFISYVVFPRGTSQIIGKLSSGDFILGHYTDILLITLLPALFNNLVLVRIIDWLDWSLDAKCGRYLSSLAFDSVIKQSMTFHDNRFSGSLTSQANKLPNAFISLKSMFVWDIFPLLLLIIYSIVTVGLVCPPFAIILISFTVIYATIAIVAFYKTREVDAKRASADNKQTGALADAIGNVLSVKAYAREFHEKQRFALATQATHDATFAVAKASNWRNFLLNTVHGVTFIITLILVIISHDLFNLSITDVVFVYSMSFSLLSNIWRVNYILRGINQSFGNAKEMVEILDLPYIIKDRTDTPLQITEAALEFKNVSFKHENQEDDLFDNFSLQIPAGQRVGLVGISGSGKTTLTKLLLRFDDVSAGAILIDNQDIRDVTQASLRQNIAYVPQESALFHRSVFENIAYGNPNATKKEVIQAAKLAHADEFIKHLPKGYDTLVGERGVKLSGGQRQRISIARAILKNAPILVLDEATSSLDSESEALIQQALINLMKNRTSIVIAHRLSTVASLDKIIVLDDGKIVEQGTHKALLKQKGEYQKLWARQSGSFL